MTVKRIVVALAILVLAISLILGILLYLSWRRVPSILDVQRAAQQRGQVIVNAIYKYRSKHGALPKDLAALADEHPEVGNIPDRRARFTGGCLQYVNGGEETWYYIDRSDSKTGFSLLCYRYHPRRKTRGGIISYDDNGKTRGWTFH